MTEIRPYSLDGFRLLLLLIWIAVDMNFVCC